MRVVGMIGYSLVALSLGVAVLVVGLLVAGHDLDRAAGELWYTLSPSSLNLFQVVVQRFLYAPLWDNGIVPFLLRPAWEALAILWVALLIVGSVLLMLGRRWRR